ncbi:MAG: RICIN domain-containing protein [Eubacteriales bacterium]|nr:RICIN domain-containing protein [Eubacteriales bacterium]
MKKIKKFLLLLVLGTILLSTTNYKRVDAATVSEAMNWCESLLGKTVGSGQCVAFIQSYYEYLGKSRVSGHARDYATNALPSGWSRVKSGTPQPGDILVYVGAKYGHVAIYAGGTTSYHQNMSGQYVEKKTNWAYNKSWYSKAEGGTKSYWGYIRPTFSDDTCNCSESYAGNYTCTSNTTLNIRSGHSTSSSVRGSIPSGATVYVSKSDGNWAHVEYNGISGCASMKYLSKINTPDPPAEIRGSEMSSGYDRVLPDSDYIIASAANPQYFLDIEGGTWPAANETNVSLYNWSGDLDTFDTWTIRYSDGFYRISQNGADVSLDVNNADTLQGANVKVHANNNSSAQKWAISRNGRNGYRLQAKCSGYSLDITDGNISNGTNVRQYSGNDTDAQAWVFVPYKPSQDIPNGRYVLLSNLDRTVEVDVPGDTDDVPNEANVQLWKDTAPSRYNSFDITKLSNGYYKIIHAASGKALDMYGGGTALGSNISLHDANGSTAQQWAITNAGGDSFIIWARCSGMVMDVENSKTENGTNISQYTYHGLPNQKWHFVKAEYPVTYDAMGGQETPAGQTKYYKSDLKLSSAVPQKKGYVFKGWNDSKELNGTLYASGSTYTKDEDLKLYAVWEKQGYKITYHLDGGVNADSNPDSYYAEDPYVRLSAPSKEGYVFEGWYFSKDGDEVVTEKTKLQGDVDLYAHWRKDGTPTLSVRWDKKMLIASVSNMDCATGYGFVYGKEAEVTLETPGRQRVAFTSVTADQTFSFDTSGVEEGNFFRGYVTYKSAGKEAVIYADPVTHPEKYKVSFDAAGGECTEASREVVWGEAVGALPEPKKDYFEFIGWYTEDGQKISENQVFSEEMVNLAASWEEKPVSKDFVREDQLPSGARIVEEKYTYTKRNYTESSGSEMSGWIRYDRKRTGWGGQQGPVYSDPSNGERNVWNESYVVSSNHKTIYHYFRYSTGHTASGGSDKPTSKYGTTLYTYDFDEPLTVLGTDGNYSRGYRYYYSGSRYCTVWKRDPFTTQEWVSDNYGTRWYYQDPVYTYYFYKDESKTSSTYPTESDISNVVKWVRYREK